jgi:hypothetical protein
MGARAAPRPDTRADDAAAPKPAESWQSVGDLAAKLLGRAKEIR